MSIKTWRARLGNSPHIQAQGALGEAMQAEIDELRAANIDLVYQFDALREDFRALKRQEHVGSFIHNDYGGWQQVDEVHKNDADVTPLYLAAGAQAKSSDYEIHKAHCFQAPYETSCKYGDDDCPMQALKGVTSSFTPDWAGYRRGKANLYLAAGAQCKPLTDDEIAEVADRMEAKDPTDSFWREFARAIEAKIRGQA